MLPSDWHRIAHDCPIPMAYQHDRPELQVAVASYVACALPRLVPLQLTLAPTARVFLCSVRTCSLPSSRSPSSLLRSHIILLRSRYSKERGNGSRAGSR